MKMHIAPTTGTDLVEFKFMKSPESPSHHLVKVSSLSDPMVDNARVYDRTDTADRLSGDRQLPEADGDLLNVCIMADNEASARKAVRVIQRVAKNARFRLTLLQFDEFIAPTIQQCDSPAPMNSDLFIVAMSQGGALPDFARMLIDRWAYLRRDDHHCALAALVTDENFPLDFHSPLIEYLGHLAVLRGLAFFYGKPEIAINLELPKLHQKGVHACITQRIAAEMNHFSPRWGIND